MEIELKLIDDTYVKNEYVEWLNDYEIVKYTEQRFERHTIKKIKNYVKNVTKSENEFLYGIFHHTKHQSKFIHIGNIKIGPIKPEHNSTEIGYIIGNKSYWGKGVMTESIRLATLICKNKYNLSKINAGVYENNIGSIRALEKNNFIEEGTLKSQVIFENKRINIKLFGKKI